jgi:hypothetical protein
MSLKAKPSAHDFKLYIKVENHALWDIIQDYKSKGVNPSDLLCKMLLQQFCSPAADAPTPLKKQDDFLTLSIKDFHERNEKGIIDIVKHVEYKLRNNEITEQDIVDLATNYIIGFNQIFSSDFMYNLFEESREFIIMARRDTLNPVALACMKKEIAQKLRDDFQRIRRTDRLNESDRKADLEKQRDEDIRLETEAWLIDNPGKLIWMKGLTDEQIEAEERIDKAIVEGRIIENYPCSSEQEVIVEVNQDRQI